MDLSHYCKLFCLSWFIDISFLYSINLSRSFRNLNYKNFFKNINLCLKCLKKREKIRSKIKFLTVFESLTFKRKWLFCDTKGKRYFLQSKVSCSLCEKCAHSWLLWLIHVLDNIQYRDNIFHFLFTLLLWFLVNDLSSFH